MYVCMYVCMYVKCMCVYVRMSFSIVTEMHCKQRSPNFVGLKAFE